MDPVAEALGRALERWCGAAPGTYGLDTTLSYLWAQAHGGAIPYDPDGVDTLIAAILGEAIFANCAQMNDLEDFLRGDNRSVGDLYNYLVPCG